MGIRSGICVFLRPPCYGDSERTGWPGSGEKEIGFEIPDFPKTRAPALRFGSINSISEVLPDLAVQDGAFWGASGT